MPFFFFFVLLLNNSKCCADDVKQEDAQAISTRKYPIPSPTIIFLKPAHLNSIVNEIIATAKESWFLYPIAWRHKLAGVSDGFITNQSLWDRLVFDGARAKVLGHVAATLRAVVVSGGTLFYPSFSVSYVFFLQDKLPATCSHRRA
jgi:hypothetical protein